MRSGLRLSTTPHGVAGAFAGGIAELSDDLASATTITDLGAAIARAAGILRADDVALMRVDREAGELELLSAHHDNPTGMRWPLADFPATRYVLDHRVPGQVVVGDEFGDPAELAELAELGMASVLIVPVVYGGRDCAVLEVYRVLPQAFTAREVDWARVLAQQFGAALDRLT
jgi:GAF domain-containing protein